MMYELPRYKIMLVKDGSAAAPVTRIRQSTDVTLVMKPILEGADRERFYVLALDGKSQIIGINLVSEGTLTMSLVHPREVFKSAILLNAAAIICVHNHPSGDPEPSPEDRAITDRLAEAGKLMGIALLDHLIIGSTHFSFADAGLIGKKG